MTTVRRALALSFLERYLLLLLGLATSIIFARILTPEEIGIYSVSLAVIGIAQVMRDFGIGNFLIQEKNLSDDHIRTAFGFSLLIGGGLFTILLISSPLIAQFYGETRMTSTLSISALNFMVLPFCTISLALLRREMKFKELLYISLAASVLGFVVSISAGLAGLGANSMAVGAVVTNIAMGFGAWICQPQRRILRPSLSQWRQLLQFGGQSAVTNVITTVSMDINDLALGKIFGFTPVAIYSRAQGLTNLFARDLMAAIRNVAFPAFAQAFRNGESVEARHVQSVGSVTSLAWPFFGFLALFPLEILRLLYGPQWDSAAPLVPILAVAGALYATSNLVLSVIMAAGRIDLVTRFELIFQPLRAAVIVGVALVYGSLLACAIAYLLMFAMYSPLAYMIKQRCLPNDWSALRAQLLRSGQLTLITLLLPAALSLWFGLDRATPLPLGWFAIAITVCAIAWVLALKICKHPFLDDPLGQRWLKIFSFRTAR